MTIKELESIVGTLSKPSKMPCFSYSTPAEKCIVGSKLHELDNSVCSDCYALKGNYQFENVKIALQKRFDSLKNPEWVDTIAELIKRKEKSGFFRWHDSGDLQSKNHLTKIIKVAKALPNVKFWIPTREYNIVNGFIEACGIDCIPENLTIRLSALMIDGSVTERQNPFDLPTSEVRTDGFTCPSSLQGNKCLNCRKCWDKNVKKVIYKKH